MTEPREPSEEFVDRLEWQIRREMRRQDRFEAEQPPSWWWRRGLRTAALVVVSVIVGYAGATAAQDASEQRRQELLELQSRSRLEMAELQLSFAADRLGELERLLAGGEIAEESLGWARMDRAAMEREVARARLDLEELELTGREPRDDLGAPLVDGRDMLSERLRLQLRAMRDRQILLAYQVEIGMDQMEPIEVESMRAQLQRVQSGIALIRRTIALREQVLDGSLKPDEALRQRELLEARMQAEGARVDARLARMQWERIQSLAGSRELDRLAAEHQLQIAETQAEMAELRLQLLREGTSIEE